MLLLDLERRPDHARGGVVHDDVESPELLHFPRDPFGGDVPAQEHRLGAEAAQLLGRLLGGPVVAEVAERDLVGAQLGEAERDGLTDPPRAARHEDGGAFKAHSRGGSGSYSGAELGTVSQPMRLRGSRRPSRAVEDARPRRSRSAICSSAYLRTSLSSGSSSTSSRTRARIWYAKCGVAGPTRASTSATVGSRSMAGTLTAVGSK